MENEFACPSGCMAPETCVNIPLIQGFSDVNKNLEIAASQSAAQLIRITGGDLDQLQMRRDTVATTKQALLGSCALFVFVQRQHSEKSIDNL